MASKSFTVPNISCGHCANTIEREVKEIQGVTAITVEVESKMVKIEWSEPPASWTTIRATLEEINFPPDDS